MSEKFSKEHILQVVQDTQRELAFDFTDQVLEEINKLDTESRNEPAYREIIAARVAQTSTLAIMTEVLYKLLNE